MKGVNLNIRIFSACSHIQKVLLLLYCVLCSISPPWHSQGVVVTGWQYIKTVTDKHERDPENTPCSHQGGQEVRPETAATCQCGFGEELVMVCCVLLLKLVLLAAVISVLVQCRQFKDRAELTRTYPLTVLWCGCVCVCVCVCARARMWPPPITTSLGYQMS